MPQFPSTPQYLRAFPGPNEDSWYVYASGFTPRSIWVLLDVPCLTLPCEDFGAADSDLVKEDGTMTFYMQLPRASDPSKERLLAAMPQPLTGGGVVPNAPSIKVAGHNLGGGFGYPKGTRTAIAVVDEVAALVEAGDTAAIRSRLVLKEGTTSAGVPVRGVASWQCAPWIQPEGNLDQIFEYPAGLVYAVFRVPGGPSLPLRYRGASYGIAWYDGGAGLPLGGLISGSGQIVGTEIRCGTTPGYHVHNFTGLVLQPFTGPAPAAPTPKVPNTGAGLVPHESASHAHRWLVYVGLLLIGASGAAVAGSGWRGTRRA